MSARAALRRRGACLSCCAPAPPLRRSAARPCRRSARGAAASRPPSSLRRSASSSCRACFRPDAHSLALLLELRGRTFSAGFSGSRRFSDFFLLGADEDRLLDLPSFFVGVGGSFGFPLPASRRSPGRSSGGLPAAAAPPEGVPAGVHAREGSSSPLSSESEGTSMQSARSSAAPPASYSSSSGTASPWGASRRSGSAPRASSSPSSPKAATSGSRSSRPNSGSSSSPSSAMEEKDFCLRVPDLVDARESEVEAKVSPTKVSWSME
mmetsp:Transcript_25717/g.80766  ORF Transcript_25717/g.80766 Transcript_25717/m.80766 type:complete len:266 (-) Transcript_25717:168-965(-)